MNRNDYSTPDGVRGEGGSDGGRGIERRPRQDYPDTPEGYERGFRGGDNSGRTVAHGSEYQHSGAQSGFARGQSALSGPGQEYGNQGNEFRQFRSGSDYGPDTERGLRVGYQRSN